jgi:hypothetical protein
VALSQSGIPESALAVGGENQADGVVPVGDHVKTYFFKPADIPELPCHWDPSKTTHA